MSFTQLLPSVFVALFAGLASPAWGRPCQTSWEAFVVQAGEKFGEEGASAARFLSEQHPESDANLDAGLLLENLDFALRARGEFPWARKLPLELFHNDVLPYAVFDETRENWRPEMYALAKKLVSDCESASQAAQALNRQLFNSIGVHYNTGRKRPNQSPSESIESGRATCTGLSILLIDACRSVGIPARAVGVAQWNGKRGNHTWVEIWDGKWRFTGADEFDAKGLDRGWFVGDARKALAGVEKHAVWASSWGLTGSRFPMVWDQRSDAVAGVDVTLRYAPEQPIATKLALRNLRAWTQRGGKRLALPVRILNSSAEPIATHTTRAEPQDLNDMPMVSLDPTQDYVLEVENFGFVRRVALAQPKSGEETLDLHWDELDLGEEAAQKLIDSLYDERQAELEFTSSDELEAKTIQVGDSKLRYLERSFGEEPENGHSLWISMHGGGGAPTAVNDAQWRNQIGLYKVEEGIYIAPRAPTDSWNMWHQGHIDALFARLIESFVAARGVDPKRVYLLGYSAGGDGVYQLAPRMADRFAAASMMAGHPNEARPLGLRNLPFALFMGGQDGAYDRNKIAAQWNAKLDDLQQSDPEGYPHRYNSYPECGHWMDGQDAEGLPWMADFERQLWPSCVVWYQDDVLHQSSYWLQAVPGEAAKGQLIRATVKGQTIYLESAEVQRLILRLHDRLIDLDQEIVVMQGKQQVFRGRVARSEKSIRASVETRLDREWTSSALLELSW
jgi:predicted esterase